MEIRKAGIKPGNIPDDSILALIWRSLWDEELIGTINIQDISVIVENREVCLSGHVSENIINQRIEEIIRSIPGVIAVHNHLVTDYELRNQVAEALDQNESTRLFTLPVSCCHGWVELGGLVPTREIQRSAEETAASVATVRGVILLPNIKGEDPFPARNAVQPRIGVRVYGDDEGTVYQVVVNPKNRLVTHAIVRTNQLENGWQKSCDYLLPIEVIQLVDAFGIFLIHPSPAINQFAVFTPSEYPFPPLTWHPPYPYTTGNVRWPRLEAA